MLSWHYEQREFIETPVELQNFFYDIEAVCKKHNMSISHEDSHGAFIITPYYNDNINWLKDAFIGY